VKRVGGGGDRRFCKFVAWSIYRGDPIRLLVISILGIGIISVKESFNNADDICQCQPMHLHALFSMEGRGTAREERDLKPT